MSTDEDYNGYTNRETWLVALWIDNDQGWAESVQDDLRTRLIGDNPDPDDLTLGVTAYAAGQVVQENVEQVIHGDQADGSLATDLLQHALARVNWTELGKGYLDQLAEEAKHSDLHHTGKHELDAEAEERANRDN